MINHYFTCIENNLIEYIMKNIKKGAQIKILLCIARFTNGFHRKEALLSTSFMAKYTGLSQRGILREIAELEKMGVICRRTDKSLKTKVLGINPAILGTPDLDVSEDSDLPDNLTYDKSAVVHTELEDIQEIKNIKYTNINKTESDIPLPDYSSNLQKSLRSWYRAHDMNMQQMEALIRITDKYLKVYDDDAVAEVIDQCLAEGRNGVYFDRLHGTQKSNPKTRQIGELENMTWESLS